MGRRKGNDTVLLPRYSLGPGIIRWWILGAGRTAAVLPEARGRMLDTGCTRWIRVMPRAGNGVPVVGTRDIAERDRRS